MENLLHLQNREGCMTNHRYKFALREVVHFVIYGIGFVKSLFTQTYSFRFLQANV